MFLLQEVIYFFYILETFPDFWVFCFYLFQFVKCYRLVFVLRLPGLTLNLALKYILLYDVIKRSARLLYKNLFYTMEESV